MNNLTDIASENQRQWKSINALTAEVKTLSGAVGAQNEIAANYAVDKERFNLA